MDENDRKAARQVLPAEEPLDVSHVRDEPPNVKSHSSTDRDDATRQQRQAVRSPEDEGIEDEAPRRRASRPRSQAVHRRRPRADEFEDFGAIDEDELDAEDAEFEGEAPRRRARRSRTGAVSHRRARVVEDFDALDEDEFDEDELDDEEELQTEPSKARRRVEAKASRHGRGYDLDDDALVRRSRRHLDELEEFDEFDDEDIENALPPRRLTHRSHGPRARATNDYDPVTPWTMNRCGAAMHAIAACMTSSPMIIGGFSAFEGSDRPRHSMHSGIAKHAARGIRTNTRRCPLAVSTRTWWNASSMMNPPRR